MNEDAALADYQSALGKSVQPVEGEETNTDTSAQRELRAKNEVKILEKLHVIRGLSLYERLLFVRENLFDGNVKGDRSSNTRTTDLYSGDYVRGEYVNKWGFAAFSRLADSLSDQVASLEEEKQPEAALRLAAIIYSLGVMLHPYADANGQTLRLVALSYIQEYCPALRENTFPIKRTAKEKPPINIDFFDYIYQLLDHHDHGVTRNLEKFLSFALTLIKPRSKQKLLDGYEKYIETGEFDSEHKQLKVLFSMFDDFKDEMVGVLEKPDA
jgi:hypothetical protein